MIFLCEESLRTVSGSIKLAVLEGTLYRIWGISTSSAILLENSIFVFPGYMDEDRGFIQKIRLGQGLKVCFSVFNAVMGLLNSLLCVDI